MTEVLVVLAIALAAAAAGIAIGILVIAPRLDRWAAGDDEEADDRRD
jgi:NADH:ubiquinone oxidoreductase subunit K